MKTLTPASFDDGPGGYPSGVLNRYVTAFEFTGGRAAPDHRFIIPIIQQDVGLVGPGNPTAHHTDFHV